MIDPPSEAGPSDAAEEWDGDEVDAPSDVVVEAIDAAEDASAPGVRVALYPTPAQRADGGMDEAADAEAVLMALAAGASGVVVDLPWSELDESEDWAKLGPTAKHLNDERKHLLLSVSVVDATEDVRPSSLGGQAWSSGSTRDAMRAVIDQVFATFGQELVYVSFGMEVDRYLASRPTQAPAFVGFMVEALEYARGHASRPEGTEVGVTWSASAWLEGAEQGSDRARLMDASDAVMLSYYGLNESSHALAPSEAVAALGVVVDSIDDRPVVLHRVAYTSSTLLGSDESSQAAFVSELFTMVGQQRARVAFLGVAALHDPTPEACLRFAQARDPSSSAELYAFWCSAGLRELRGDPKEGFSAFLSAVPGLQ